LSRNMTRKRHDQLPSEQIAKFKLSDEIRGLIQKVEVDVDE
jgi:hypothetical protein